jgi:cardiolipin synthase
MLSQLAGQSLYRRLLRAGVEIYEYQPQILHAKLLIMDDTIQIGSANLDPRSMSINYELMIRLQDPEVAEQAKAIFASAQQHSQRITRDAWRESRSVWRRMKQHWAYFILVRVDPYIAHNQWQALPD